MPATKEKSKVPEASDLPDHALESADVSLRQITLVRGRFHQLDGEGRHDDPSVPVGLPIRGQHLPALPLDRLVQGRHVPRRRRGLEFDCAQARGGAGRLSSAADATDRTRLLRFLVGHRA